MSIKLRFLFLLVMMPAHARAATLTIFDVRQNIAMSDQDKVYRDFYINGGSEDGLAKGMVITVQRHIPLYDSYQNRSAGDLHVNVAKIKIIDAQKHLAVARLVNSVKRDDEPLLEDDYLMVGDQLDLSTATMDSGKHADASDEDRGMPAPQPVAAAAPPTAHISVNTIELASVSVPTPAAIAETAKPNQIPVPPGPSAKSQSVGVPTKQ